MIWHYENNIDWEGLAAFSAIVILVVLVVLVGFQPKDTFSYEGMVIAKHHIPARTETYYTTNCSKSGNTQNCVTTPHTRYVPAQYYLDVSGNDEVRTVSVYEGRYNSSYEGDTKVIVYCSTGKWVTVTWCSVR